MQGGGRETVRERDRHGEVSTKVRRPRKGGRGNGRLSGPSEVFVLLLDPFANASLFKFLSTFLDTALLAYFLFAPFSQAKYLPPTVGL